MFFQILFMFFSIANSSLLQMAPYFLLNVTTARINCSGLNLKTNTYRKHIGETQWKKSRWDCRCDIFKGDFNDWRNVPVVKSTCFSFREPRFSSQNPHCGTQPQKPPVPWITSSSGLHRYYMNIWRTYIDAGKTLVNMKVKCLQL